MELKKGYKQSDVGMIPVDWEIKYLHEIVRFNNGKAHENFISEDGDYKVVNSKFVASDGTVYKMASTSLCPLNIGDITMVMSDIPNGKALAKCYIIEKENTYTLNQRICSFNAFDGDPNFLFRILNRNKYFLAFDSGSGQTNLRKQEVLDCQVLIPPKLEQTAIAHALSDADDYIFSLKKLIEKKKAIKQGAMQQLLKPKNWWISKKLGDFLDYEQPTNYLVKDTEYNDFNQTPVLTAGKTFILGYTNEADGIYNNLPVIIFDDFTTAIKYVTFPFKAKSSAMKMLIAKNNNVNLRFIFELMLQIKYIPGDHKRHWISEYSQIEIKVPSSEQEQNVIATILSDMDNEIALLEKKLAKTKLIKQGMMQNLLTGKIRLV